MVYRLLCKLMESATLQQVDAVLMAAVKRREELFPDWEMAYIALPKNDPELRSKILGKMVQWEEGKPEKDSCF